MNQADWKQQLINVPQRFYLATQKLDIPVLWWSACVGILTGLIGSVFQLLINQIVHQRELLAQFLQIYPWLYWIIPSLLTAAMVTTSFGLMRKFAPETSGGGISQIEGYCDGLLPLNWKRVLITCLVATMVAHLLGGEPLYSVLLKRLCEKQAHQLPTDSIEN